MQFFMVFYNSKILNKSQKKFSDITNRALLKKTNKSRKKISVTQSFDNLDFKAGITKKFNP